MGRISDLIVLDRMSKQNQDIRLAKLPDNLVNIQKVAAGGHLTVGVDDGSASILMNMALGSRSYGAALIIFKYDDFDKAKAELEHPMIVATIPEGSAGFDPALPGGKLELSIDTPAEE